MVFDHTSYKSLIFVVLLIARCSKSLDNGVGLTPPMGWNGWNYLQCNINEDIVKKTADLLVQTGLAQKGYKYVNLDDCWQKSRDHLTKKIIEDPQRFKSGMASLGKYIHSKGLKFGLYSDSGYETCQRRPGSYGFQDIDAQTYAQWQVDYLKYDSCFPAPQPGVMSHSRMGRALNKTGRPIFFSICNGADYNAFGWQRYVGNAWRTTNDIEDKWESVLKTLDQQQGNEIMAGPGAWNDPDMLQVGNGNMTLNEYQAHFALWCALKAPLLIGCDISKLSKQILQILGNEQMIAVNQDRLGIQARRIKRTTLYDNQLMDVYGGWLSGNRYLMIFFNRGWYDAGAQISLRKQAQLMFSSYSQRDPLRHEDIKQSSNDLLKVPLVGNHSVQVRILQLKNGEQQRQFNLERQSYLDILPQID